MSGENVSQESLRPHPGGALAGFRTRLGADRLPDRAHPPIRAKAGGDLQGELPGNRSVEAGRGDRTALSARVRTDTGRSPPLRKSRSVGAYLGLVPATDRSGER